MTPCNTSLYPRILGSFFLAATLVVGMVVATGLVDGAESFGAAKQHVHGVQTSQADRNVTVSATRVSACATRSICFAWAGAAGPV